MAIISLIPLRQHTTLAKVAMRAGCRRFRLDTCRHVANAESGSPGDHQDSNLRQETVTNLNAMCLPALGSFVDEYRCSCSKKLT